MKFAARRVGRAVGLYCCNKFRDLQHHSAELVAHPRRVGRAFVVFSAELVALYRRLGRALYRTEHFRTFLQNTLQNFRTGSFSFLFSLIQYFAA